MTAEDLKDESGKRRRVARACDACRKKKVRCLPDPTNPSAPCPTCKSHGLACTFQEVSKKRGPPKGYVEDLEKRLETMERLLKSLAPQFEKEKEGDQGSRELEDMKKQSYSSDSHRYSMSSESPNDQYSSADTTIEDEDLTADFGEMTIENGRYIGKSSGFILARTVTAYKTQNDAREKEIRKTLPKHVDPYYPWTFPSPALPPTVETMISASKMKEAEDTIFPPEDLARILIANFFDKFNQHVPLLHPPTFFEAYESGKAQVDTSFRALCLSIFAMGSRFVEDERVLPPTSSIPDDGYPHSHSRGFEFLNSSIKSQTPFLLAATLYDLQSMAINTVYLVHAASPMNAWASVGYAIRRCQDVGAHRKMNRRWNLSPIEDQLRKRVWWILYKLDIVLSTATGRPLAAHDEDIDLDLPLDISDESLLEWNAAGRSVPPPPPSKTPTAIAGFNCAVNLQRIAGKALKTIYAINREQVQKNDPFPQWEQRVVAELDSDLNAWLETIPPHLKWNSSSDNKFLKQSAMLYSSYYSTQILVHRDFLSPEKKGLHSFPSLAICVNAARSLSHVMDTMRKRGFLKHTIGFSPLHCAQAGIILLINVFNKSSQETNNLSTQAIKDVQKCLTVLEEIQYTSFMGYKCRLGLQSLAELGDIPPGTGSTPPSIHPHASATKSPPSPPLSSRPTKRHAPDDDHSTSGTSGRDDTPPNSSDGERATNRRKTEDIHTLHSPLSHKTNSFSFDLKSPQSASSPVNLLPLPVSTNDLSYPTFMGDQTLQDWNLSNTLNSNILNNNASTAIGGPVGNQYQTLITQALLGNQAALAICQLIHQKQLQQQQQQQQRQQNGRDPMQDSFNKLFGGANNNAAPESPVSTSSPTSTANFSTILGDGTVTSPTTVPGVPTSSSSTGGVSSLFDFSHTNGNSNQASSSNNEGMFTFSSTVPSLSGGNSNSGLEDSMLGLESFGGFGMGMGMLDGTSWDSYGFLSTLNTSSAGTSSNLYDPLIISGKDQNKDKNTGF